MKDQPLLSPVEITFIRLCTEELTYKEIAQAMYRSPKTIENYRENIFIKLNVKSRIGVVMYAVHNNLVKVK